MKERAPITGPTFEEMLHPHTIDPAVREQARRAMVEAPLDPVNLYSITWHSPDTGDIYQYVLPRELTNVDAPIAVLYARGFPSGSHKVGAAYSVLLEKAVNDELRATEHTLVWPSTGNYGIGGAYVGGRMGFRSLVILPEDMSRERFERIRTYGAEVIATPGCESNVKEIYDKCKELAAREENVRILNQFEVFGNYRWHYHVTGNTIAELAMKLAQQGVGKGRVAAFVSAMGSAGTIAAGDRLKQLWSDCRTVGLEPIQCPTLYCNGYGAHDIQGIGDKHVTWIHNVWNMDAIICIDDMQCKKGLQLLSEEPGWRVLTDKLSVPEESVRQMATMFGISGVCNVLGAIKTAKYYHLGKTDLIVTILTDGIDRYHSVMADLTARYGAMDDVEAEVRLASVFHNATVDWIQEGTQEARSRWHNLKYYTWVEQQGKTVEELDAQRDPEFWLAEQAKVAEIDAKLKALR